MRFCCGFSASSLILFCFLLFFTTTGNAQSASSLAIKDGQPVNLQQQKYKDLFLELEQKYQFKSEDLQQIFQGQKLSKRVLELMDKQWKRRPYYEYFPLFLTPKTIKTGKGKLKKHKALLDRIEKKFGVEREVIVAIWGIETRFGTNQGGFNILQTLNTLFDAYPRRSEFFRKELIQFLLLCREQGVDPKTAKGSYAGAFGQAQFMPSSFRRFAVSFDGNAQCDLWNSVPDALASIANYLKIHGWFYGAPIYVELGSTLKDKRLRAAMEEGRKGRVAWELVRAVQKKDLPPSPGRLPLSIIGLELDPKTSKDGYRYLAGYPNFHTITEYNHSLFYGMAVSELAELFKEK
ncbi:MAG: lytic murein transglycosylase [Candidatus Electrothrix aestuarii]|uniref:Lytic murein transglycosylase n=1 Tax=Candidatus Electrothrix aestuarii TaxID=3062594 RepID=A0AAU8LWS4_9BACT|nr:lytic murein transglycosylase [Candidatus Electrothrix aestuarii]